MNRWLKIFWLGVLIAWSLLAFMSLTTWLGCLPLDELPTSAANAIPAGTRCFTNNRGSIAFYEHGTIHDEPLLFSLNLALLLVPAGLLMWKMWRSGMYRRFWKSPIR
jgi:hypothetical protein